ncbi:uncharacterized [Tachysurus ichikawai]
METEELERMVMVSPELLAAVKDLAVNDRDREQISLFKQELSQPDLDCQLLPGSHHSQPGHVHCEKPFCLLCHFAAQKNQDGSSSIAHQIARPPLSATHQYPACCLLPEGQTNTCCWQALSSLPSLPLHCLSEAQVL